MDIRPDYQVVLEHTEGKPKQAEGHGVGRWLGVLFIAAILALKLGLPVLNFWFNRP